MLFPALAAGEFVAFLDEALQHFASFLGDLGLDEVGLALDVHTIGHSLLMGVFGDDVLLEEAVGRSAGGGGQADEEGVEVFEDLPPEVVDGAVTFIDDDEVEELGWNLFVVGNGERFLALHRGGLGGVLLVLALGHFPALEDGIHPLDGRDADFGVFRDVGGGEALDGVEFGERAIVVVRDVSDEFLFGLLAEVAGIDEEEDALHSGVLEQAVNGGDGSEGFSGAGGHLDERARLGLGKRCVELGDGVDLAVAQPGGVERRHIVAQAAAEGWAGSQSFSESFRPVEAEDFAGARLRVALVGEAGEDAGGLVEEREWLALIYPLELGGGVFTGLVLKGGDVLAEDFFLGLDDSNRFAGDEENIVGGTGVCRILANRLPLTVAEIDGAFLLDSPSRGLQLGVDRVTCDLLRILIFQRHDFQWIGG